LEVFVGLGLVLEVDLVDIWGEFGAFEFGLDLLLLVAGDLTVDAVRRLRVRRAEEHGDLHSVVPEVLHLPDLHLQQNRGTDEEQRHEGHKDDREDHGEVLPQARDDLGEDESGPHEATP
jgi:hypothetical protein